MYGINIKTPFIEDLTHRIQLGQYCFQPPRATHLVVSTHTVLVGSDESDPQLRFFYHCSQVTRKSRISAKIHSLIYTVVVVFHCSSHAYFKYNNQSECFVFNVSYIIPMFRIHTSEIGEGGLDAMLDSPLSLRI